MQTEDPAPENTVDADEPDEDVDLSREAFDFAAVVHAEVLTGLLGEVKLNAPAPSTTMEKTSGKKKKAKKLKQSTIKK